MLAFVGVVYLAHVLGPESFGRLNFALALTAHFMLLTNLGLTRLGTQEIAKTPQLIGQYTGNIVAMRLCLASIGLLVLVVLMTLIDKPLEVKYLIVLFGAGLIPGAVLLDWSFQGGERMEYIALSRILTVGLYTVCLLLAVKSPDQLLRVPCFQFGAGLLAAAVLLILFSRTFPNLRLQFDFSRWKDLLRRALPLGIALIMVQLIYYVDTVILGFMRSDAEIGYYNAAYKIVIVCVGTAGNFFESIFPLMARYYNTAKEQFIQVQTLNVRLMFCISIPIVVGGSILAKTIILTLYGPDYQGSIDVFYLLIWIPAIVYVNTVYAWGLWAMDMHMLYMKIVAIQLAVNISFNIILIPHWGILGAAVATILSEIVGLPLYYVSFNRKVHLKFSVVYNIVKPLLSSGVMAIFLYFMIRNFTVNAFVLVSLGCAVYAVAMLGMNGITREELKSFRNMLAVR